MIRIVKLTFKPSFVEEFQRLFNTKKELIGSFPGCNGVKLLQDKSDTRIFFTYSYWDNEESLENYRKSELFLETWKETKTGFCAKPEAWSVEIQAESMRT